MIKQTTVRTLNTIINLYAPTTERVKNDEGELDQMYTDFGNLISELTKAAFTIYSSAIALFNTPHATL